ncbi:hypothetical protein D3C84_1215950 [compost metagenome]
MRTRSVSALARHADHKPVDVGIKRSAACGECTHRQTRLVVHAENSAHIVQRPGPNQTFRAAKILFSGLKQNAYATGK